MTTSAELGNQFVDRLFAAAAAKGAPLDMADYGDAIRETVEPLILGVLNNTEAAPLATQRHVDELLAEVMAALGKTEATNA